MAQPFYARKTELKIGPRKGEMVYSIQPYTVRLPQAGGDTNRPKVGIAPSRCDRRDRTIGISPKKVTAKLIKSILPSLNAEYTLSTRNSAMH